MLLKIFSRGKGSGNAPINYLLGNDYMSEGQLRAGARIVIVFKERNISSGNEGGFGPRTGIAATPQHPKWGMGFSVADAKKTNPQRFSIRNARNSKP